MSREVRQYFSDLGAAVERRWEQLGHGPSSLADAATLALQEVPAGTHVGAVAILEHALGSDLPTEQSRLSDEFGQPPLTLYSAPDFFIQALTWIDGTTAVHQHAFDGAFAVAEGASLHVPYRFSPKEVSSEGHLVAGDLVMGEPEVLRPGAVRSIGAGFGFVHALFHLERPTVTIVVRNVSSSLPYPQYNFLRPGLGYDALWSDRVVGKRLQALGALHRIAPSRASQECHDLIVDGNPWVAFLALRDTLTRLGWTHETADLVAILSRRLGGLVGECLLPALRDELVQRNVLLRRGLLHGPHQRLFLALLANLPDQTAMSRVVASLYPDREPGFVVLDWIAELASSDFRSVSGLRLTDEQLRALEHRRNGLVPLDQTDLGAVLRAIVGEGESPMLLKDLLSS